MDTWLQDPLNPRYAAATMRVFAWIVWTGIALVVIVATGGRLRRRQWTRLFSYVPGPLQTIAATVIGAATVTAAGSAASAYAAPPANTAIPDAQGMDAPGPPPTAQNGQGLNAPLHAGTKVSQKAVAAAAGDRMAATVTVHRGDSLSKIAKRRLGDADRWPEIFALNRGRMLPGGALTNPDLIYPGWRLVLPDQTDRPADGEQRTPARDGATHRPAHPEPATPTTSSGSAAASDPRSPVATGTATGADGPATGSRGSSTTPYADPGHFGRAHTDDDGDGGVLLPAGWISLPLAGSLIAASAMVWLRRRHRYVPGSGDGQAKPADPGLRPLPAVMTTVNREVHRQAPGAGEPKTTAPIVADYTSGATQNRPDLPPYGPDGLNLAGLGRHAPATGLGLAGVGALAAARALLVATLSSGTPQDPDAKGQAVVTADTLAVLLGGGAAAIAATPRLHVATDLAEALTHLEEMLAERHRSLIEYDAANFTQLRAADPFHPPMPPVLLLTESPPDDLHGRLVNTAQLGAAVQISTVLLGQWTPGDTVTVESDGKTNGGRIAVLDLITTIDLLAMLHEAHTGEPASMTPAPALDPVQLPAPVAADAAGSRPDTVTASPDVTPTAETHGRTAMAEPADTSGRQHSLGRSVNVHLLGKPVILDRGGNPVTGLRHHARELLVYLTVHRGGADLPDIMEAMWPDATIRRAAERLSTEVADLRRRIRQAAADTTIQPVVNTGGRYHLDPALLDIDVWRVSDALQHATTANPETQATLFRQAIAAHNGTLAEGYDYDWIEQAREHMRRLGIRARTSLADLIVSHDPQGAAEILRAAALLDPINEDLARRAMRVLAAVNNKDAVRAVLDRLRQALNEIDEEPSAESLELAAQL